MKQDRPTRRLTLTRERLAELTPDDLARVQAGKVDLPTLGYNCSMRQSCGIVCIDDS
jgi:hypothetical protein